VTNYLGTVDGAQAADAVTSSLLPSVRVVGLDLSLTGTGVAVIDEGGIRTSLIRSKGNAGASLFDRAVRLVELSQRITDLIPERALVVIEQPAYSQTGGSHHDRSGLWWLIVAYLHGTHRTVEVTPGTLKKYAAGKGTAGKDEMLAAAIRRYPSVAISNNNVADALHLAAMGARHLGQPIEGDTVKIAEAMTVPRWTE
jgi:Holliday junction resolvasome RuvABC endonuclease subunit